MVPCNIPVAWGDIYIYIPTRAASLTLHLDIARDPLRKRDETVTEGLIPPPPPPTTSSSLEPGICSAAVNALLFFFHPFFNCSIRRKKKKRSDYSYISRAELRARARVNYTWCETFFLKNCLADLLD